MIFRFVVIRVFSLVILLATVVGHATASHRSINLVSGPDYAPYVSDELPEGGVVTEVVKRVFSEMGYHAELFFFPWNRGYQRVLNVQSDATFPYAWGADRAEQFLYSRAVNRVTIRVFMHRDAAFDFTEANDLEGLSYCQPLGYQTEPELRYMIEQKQLVRYEARDMDGCFEMLSAKRVDFVVSNDLVGWSAAQRAIGNAAEQTVVTADEPFRAISEYLIISKQHPQAEILIETFNIAYEALLEAGVLDGIWKSRLGRHAQAVK